MSRIYCVSLRKPVDPDDKRADPMYVSGSFGSTGCHSNGLLSDVGMKQGRLKKGDRLMFVQGPKIVFITPPLKQIERVRGHNVAFWNSQWEQKQKRPLKLEYGMELDLDQARMINPRINSLRKVRSHLRTYVQPAKDPDTLLKEYKAFVQKQTANQGNEIYIENYCETFCEDERCKGCKRLIKPARAKSD
jgi:hypothetical protein